MFQKGRLDRDGPDLRRFGAFDSRRREVVVFELRAFGQAFSEAREPDLGGRAGEQAVGRRRAGRELTVSVSVVVLTSASASPVVDSVDSCGIWTLTVTPLGVLAAWLSGSTLTVGFSWSRLQPSNEIGKRNFGAQQFAVPGVTGDG